MQPDFPLWVGPDGRGRPLRLKGGPLYELVLRHRWGQRAGARARSEWVGGRPGPRLRQRRVGLSLRQAALGGGGGGAAAAARPARRAHRRAPAAGAAARRQPEHDEPGRPAARDGSGVQHLGRGVLAEGEAGRREPSGGALAGVAEPADGRAGGRRAARGDRLQADGRGQDTHAGPGRRDRVPQLQPAGRPGRAVAAVGGAERGQRRPERVAVRGGLLRQRRAPGGLADDRPAAARGGDRAGADVVAAAVRGGGQPVEDGHRGRRAALADDHLRADRPGAGEPAGRGSARDLRGVRRAAGAGRRVGVDDLRDRPRAEGQLLRGHDPAAAPVHRRGAELVAAAALPGPDGARRAAGVGRGQHRGTARDGDRPGAAADAAVRGGDRDA